jgi:cytoskeletal protein RodZ
MDRAPTNDDHAVPAPAASLPSGSNEGRASVAAWLTAGRMARGYTREHVARVTRIQLRTLERLEEGRFDELPADVFVRGFIRNYARCVGLSVDEALTRYGACGFAAAPVASPQAHALLDAMAPLHAPNARATTSSVVLVPPSRAAMGTEPVVLRVPAPPAPPAQSRMPATAAAVEPAPSSLVEAALVTRPRRVRDSKGRFLRKSEISAQIEAVSADAVLDEELEVEITVDDFVAAANELLAQALPEAFQSPDSTDSCDGAITEAKAPIALPVVESIPVLRDARPVVTVRTSAAHSIPSIPTITIDDDDPDAAERELEDRAKREKDGGWRSFLPPALLDQDKGRQGGLTLAVIILLIVATLTLSYLMRRPSSTGEGVTAVPSAPSATLLV